MELLTKQFFLFSLAVTGKNRNFASETING